MTFRDGPGSVEQFAPSWWRSPNQRTWLRAFGGVLDDMADRTYDGRRAAVPYSAQIKAPDILAVANSGAGEARLTLDNAVQLYQAGITEVRLYSSETTGGLVLDGTWPINFVDSTHVDLVGSTWTGSYVGGAVMAFVGLHECDEDALEFHALDRDIRLYQSEPLLSKRYRLSRWHQLRQARGSHFGELENLQPFWMSTPTAALPWMKIFFQDHSATPRSYCYTLSPTGERSVRAKTVSIWDYDGQPNKRARFWLVIHLPAGYGPAYYDDGSVYDGGRIYDGLRSLFIADIVGAVLEAKAAHSRLAGVITTALQPTDEIPGHPGRLVFDPMDVALTDAAGWTSLPSGNWGSAIDPVTHLGTRPPWASFIYEDNP